MFLLQSEASAFAPFVREPIALVIVVIGTILIIIVKITLPKHIEKKAETRIKEIESNERISLEENNRLIINMGSTAQKIEEAVMGLTVKYDELSKSFKTQAQLTSRMSRQIDVLIFYNKDAEIIDRLIAFNWCLKAGRNGKLFQDGCTLIVHNKSTWLWILENDQYKQPENEKYQKLLAKIERSIFAI